MDYPEINFAKRLVYKRRLKPPVDIFKITKEYASVEIEYIPFEIDGITLNLKIPGKKPYIILNGHTSVHRMRFTLAHELGHILMPWHMGNIIDITRESKHLPKYMSEYWELESEANRFASELLMPSNWVKSQIKRFKTPEEMMENIVELAHVSSHAATISLIRTLEPGYVFALMNENNEVIFSGRSNGTLASAPDWNSKIDPVKQFPFCKKFYQFEIDRNIFIWWHFTDDVRINKIKDERDWREILNQIVDEIEITVDTKAKFKQRINGVIASANSRVRGESRNFNSLYSACIQRMYSRENFQSVVSHSDFESFLIKKVKDLLER